MTELEVTGDRIFKVWWLLTWRVAAVGIVFTILLEVISRWAPAAHGYARILELVVMLAWNIKVTGMALRKKYEDFRIVLVPIETPPAS